MNRKLKKVLSFFVVIIMLVTFASEAFEKVMVL